MTQARRELIARLTKLQNLPEHVGHDILTITGFMSDAEVAAHVARYEADLKRRAA